MRRLFFVILIVLFAFLSGCGGNGSLAPTILAKGSLKLTISKSQLNSKTIQPDLDMTIATYDISGTGPNGTNFQKNNVTPGSTVTINALAVGVWTIEVVAKNPVGIMIASGVSNVDIFAGSGNTAEINLLPLTGTGELNVSVSWPAGIINAPSVTGILSPIAGGNGSNITFTLAGDELSATYQDNALEAGYYTLLVQLKDGSAVKWGAIETVRIIAGQTSTGGFPLTDNPGQIGVQLVINPDLQNPIAISISGQQANLPVGTNMTVIATTNQDPVDSYQWYINGTLLTGETGPSLTFGSSLNEGSYRLDLVVVKGNIAGSLTHNFEVGGSGGGNITYNHQPIPSDYLPRIPVALSENSETNNWQMAPQMVSNFNNWMNNPTIQDVAALKNITESCIFRGLDLTYETGTNLDADPNYTVKITMKSGGALRALFFCNDDRSRWRHIIFSQGTTNGEIRELRYTNDGIVAHVVLLFYRMNVAQMNDVIEIWHYSDEEQIKSIRVHQSSGPDIVQNFGADVNLASGKHHTTAFINASDHGTELTLGYFNDDNYFVDENTGNPNPALYPSFQQAENVYNTNGITPEIVANITIDENLNSNFYQLYPNF